MNIPFPTLFFSIVFTVCIIGQPLAQVLTYTADDGTLKPVKNKKDLQEKRKQVLEGMQDVMGKLPYNPKAAVPVLRIADSIKTDKYTRYTIAFDVAENEPVSAYLYIPVAGNRHKFPAMLALHPTNALGMKSVDGQGTVENRGYAKELAERGYVVIAPDYPSFGDAKDYNFKTDRYESATMKGIFNHMRCVDILASRKEVDPDRIGVIGHSLGGHNAMFVAAFDPRLKVVVTSCGWTLFDYYNIGEEASKKYGGRLGPWAQERYMPLFRDKYGLDGKKIPFDFDGVIAVIAPRAFFSNSPVNDSNFDVAGVRKGIANASWAYQHKPDMIQVRYPASAHDFPTETRMEAYRFIDRILKN
ncbi:hypothetical protein DYBT9275_00396 [Dyadobacter sp. CECT 9275]|uniref:4-O-methyl-glucuronoyl methylesterase-like domain-containing protein n=1 Tax=Dyadobacter helix TaxID=2822344 RepID=A0A916NJK7_9BACT|nr:alpha/beta hydrolase [Dyadobacter sp. CECT 9275]CAG4989858.1 hypothetical protein DYBT9275_00396 [Dyadobacter sp. CECT 9275]